MIATFSLQHLARPPQIESENLPLLLLLHGIGSNEHDLFQLAPYLDERFLILSLRAPNDYFGYRGSYCWFHADFATDPPRVNADEAERSRTLIIQFVDEAVQAYHADAHRVCLMG